MDMVNNNTSQDKPNGDPEDEDITGEEMEDVDHTHPDTDESFTETGVYDRGKKRPKDADDG